MGVLREELRHNLLNAGAVIVGFATLEGNEKLPFPALPQVVSYAVKVEGDDEEAEKAAADKTALLAEHAKACLRRYGFGAEVMPALGGSDDEFPNATAALSACLAEKSPEGQLVTPEYGTAIRFGTVFTDATWKKKKANS